MWIQKNRMDKYIKTPCILLAVGHCGSGKTVAMEYTIKTLKAFDFIVIISNTALFNNSYDFLKDMGINHRIYNGSNCDKIFKTIMKIQEFSKDRKRVCICADDILGSLTNSKTFLKLASTYRHFNISLFLTSQYVSAQTTIIRELANYCFIFESRTDSSRKAIYQSYFGDCGTFIEFKKMFNTLKPYYFYFLDRPGKKRLKMTIPFVEKKNDEITELEENWRNKRKFEVEPPKTIKLRFLTKNDENPEICENDEKSAFLSKFSH